METFVVAGNLDGTVGPNTTVSTGVYDYNKPRKEAGFCEKNGIEHCWQDGPTYTSNPPIYTRSCINCGKGQTRRPSQWE